MFAIWNICYLIFVWKLEFSALNLHILLQRKMWGVWAFSFSLVAYSGNLIRFLFLRVLRYFSSPSSPTFALRASRTINYKLTTLNKMFIVTSLTFRVRATCSTNVFAHLHVRGFPHSDTAGSLLRDNSPTTFAVLHVLLRHTMPRHPLHAWVE